MAVKDTQVINIDYDTNYNYYQQPNYGNSHTSGTITIERDYTNSQLKIAIDWIYRSYIEWGSPASWDIYAIVDAYKIGTNNYDTIAEYQLSTGSTSTNIQPNEQISMSGSSTINVGGNGIFPKIDYSVYDRIRIRIRDKNNQIGLWGPGNYVTSAGTLVFYDEYSPLKVSNGNIKNNSTWKNATTWLKVNGVWKRCKLFEKISGVWKPGK